MKLKLKPLAILSVLAFSSHLIKAQTTLVDSFMVGGIMRNFRIYVPAIYNGATAVPLVLNLHGYTSNAVQQEFYSNFITVADTANFILVHPNGTTDLNGDQFWNNFDGSNVDDVGFLATLIDTLVNRYSIDENRIYSTGMSNGGFMSYDLACFLSTRIAAIASVTGSMALTHIASCNPSHPTPVMQIHGTTDPTVPYLGNAGFSSIESLVNYWVTFNNCNTTPAFTALPDISTTDGCTAEHYVYSGGNQGATVELYKVISGGHTWPGAAISIGITNQDFKATKEIWRFFSQYRLNVLLDAQERGLQQTDLIYPNPANELITIHACKGGFTITDIYGKVWLKSVTEASYQLVDVSKLAEGIYFVSAGDSMQRFAISGR